ncbi:MAG: DUF4105 domain-containing protein [Marinospirillum sp.]|uniref:Lnb N-terminal periplasmic domain-containing protein n=1 Tax=Marinospirillum sp. TaxID=2183934 RepID=UPI0019FA7853|nr:DUF4105 domain-containing protein [Marinospirillum sp.]MBE0508461.1 DUF4105 domain-containing protein [Marinospirillum sp.]
MQNKAALIVVVLLCFFSVTVYADTKTVEFSQISATEKEHLSSENAWWRLIHYKRRLQGVRSQVDDDKFFLHPQGARNPAAELDATLAALNNALVDELNEADDVRCRFPARTAWLNTKLDQQIPERQCDALEDWLGRIDAGSLSLIFPAAYMNNASSMFGHSLLRIDARDKQRNPDLVAWAVNFAAVVDEGDGGLAYAIKGMIGQYPGYFSLMPYYEKVNEYSYLESRDIWEYPLSLSEKGLRRVLLHMWELDEVRFDYWFFDENCSYQLLALLSVAEDHLDLTRGFDIKALPVDTVRALSQAGLLEDQGHFRPSFATRLQSMSEQVTSDELEFARILVFDQPDPAGLYLPESVRAERVYELAFQWLNFRFQHQKLPRDQAAPQLHRLLVARSKVQNRSGFIQPEIPEVPPHQGHDTAQWSIGFGQHESELFMQLAAKPSYHSRFDAVEGYLPNAEINLFELTLRYYEEEERLEPWHLKLVEVGNYLPSSPIFRMSAWRVQVEAGRVNPLAKTKDDWRTRTGGGYGRAWGSTENLMTYLMLAAELEVGPQAGVSKKTTDPEWAIGAGLVSGFVWEPIRSLRTGLDVRLINFPAGATGNALHAEGTVQWNYARNQSIRLLGQLEKREEENHQVHLSWLRFF